MKRKITFTLLLTGITLSTSSCSIVNTEAISNLWNAWTFYSAVNFVLDNWLGLGAIAIATGLARSFKYLHLIKFQWLARGAAVGIVMGMFLSFALFYAQFHDAFKEVYIIIIES